MRECFSGWSTEEMRSLVGKEDSDFISVEDLEKAKKVLQKRRVNTYKQAAKIISNKNEINKASDPVSGLHALLSRDPLEEVGFTSADQRINAIRSLSYSQLDTFMSDMAPSARQIFAGMATGRRGLSKEQDALMKGFVRELYGNQTGNGTAQKAAKNWNKLTEGLETRFIRAGGDIAILDDWRLPQVNDPGAIREAGQEEWISKIWNKLDQEKMFENMGEGAGQAELREALKDSFLNIVTDGASSSRQSGRKSLGVTNEHRFLIYKDAESWLEYQNEFGEQNIYASLLSHVDKMSRSIGMLETFGPDPEKGFKALEDMVKVEKLNPNATKRPRETFEMLMGNMQSEYKGKWADGIAAMRNLFVASKLGGAAISALSDTAYGTSAAIYNGLPASKMMIKMFNEAVKSPRNKQSKKAWAQDFGLTADFALDRMFMTNEQEQVFGANRTRNMAHAVTMASGLDRWTQSARATFQYEFATALTRALEKGVPAKMKKSLGRYGITQSDLSEMRKAGRSEFKGNSVVDIKSLEPELQTKIIGMLDGETLMAVPSPDARTRSFLAMGTKSGTLGGELLASLKMFHSFSVSLIMNQWRRFAKGKAYSNQADRYADAALVLGMATILGVGIHQGKQILAGKDLKDWESKELWMQGMAQGGGFSYVGDLVKNSTSKFQHDASSYVGGPVWDFVNFLALTSQDIGEGNFDKIPAHSAKFLNDNMPFQNLWYSKLATERLLFDRVNRLVDPDWNKKQFNKMRKMRRETGQTYWWKPKRN